MQLPYSRKMEMEADHIGLVLMSRACYNPAYAPHVFMMLAHDAEPEGALAVLSSTHPSMQERTKKLREVRPFVCLFFVAPCALRACVCVCAHPKEHRSKSTRTKMTLASNAETPSCTTTHTQMIPVGEEERRKHCWNQEKMQKWVSSNLRD